MENYSVLDSVRLYGIENWGAPYFDVNDQGRLVVRPVRDDARSTELLELVQALRERNVRFPVLLRFPQILDSQLEALQGAFDRAIKEFGYRNEFRGVFPIKVNQRREVVEELVTYGRRHSFGLEAGSKPELAVALAADLGPDAFVICNGYKDREYITAALRGRALGRNVFLIVEKPHEVDDVVTLARELGIEPRIGVRLKLRARGSGLWERSGGEAAKFGLTTQEILDAVALLKKRGMLHALRMVHFHVGSQITEIKKIKNAIKEAARTYAKLRKTGVKLEYLDIGGGLGVDYDGSRTSFDSSTNYTLREYANDVVYTIKEICEMEDVAEPLLISESGRALSAYHAVLVTEVSHRTQQRYGQKLRLPKEVHQVVREMLETLDGMTAKNYREFYHDALEQRDELFSLFNLGYLSLEEKAKGELIFREICRKAVRYSHGSKFQSEEFEDLEREMAAKYIANFSVFQSIPDHWALDQLFPIVPIHRLNERPTVRATLCDLTCDSDGTVDKFVDLKDVKETLELHALSDGPYYVGIFLIGAYQDVLGDFHNLFGAVNEAHVVVDDEARPHVAKIVPGDTVERVLELFRYDRPRLLHAFQALVDRNVAEGGLTPKEARRLVAEYRDMLASYTYLDLRE